MIQILSTVLHNEMLAPNYGRISLSCGGLSRVQSPVNSSCWVSRQHPPLLRRPFSIHRLIMADGRCQGIELLYKTVGPATRQLARVRTGEAVSLLGRSAMPFRSPPDPPPLPGGRRRRRGADGFSARMAARHAPAPPVCRLFLGGAAGRICCAQRRSSVWGPPCSDDGRRSCGDQCLVTNPLEEAIRASRPTWCSPAGPRPCWPVCWASCAPAPSPARSPSRP